MLVPRVPQCHIYVIRWAPNLSKSERKASVATHGAYYIDYYTSMSIDLSGWLMNL